LQRSVLRLNNQFSLVINKNEQDNHHHVATSTQAVVTQLQMSLVNESESHKDLSWYLTPGDI